MSDLSKVNVAQGVTLIESGRTYQSVATLLGVSKSVVYRAIKSHQETGAYKRRRGQGRKPATNAQDNRFMAITALRKQTYTTEKVNCELRRSRGVRVCTKSVKKTLADQGIKSFRALRAPPLTVQHKRQRREYAQNYRNWTAENWDKVLFTDECRFCLKPDDRRVKVLRRKNERNSQCNIFGTVQFGGGSTMVWGGVTLGGRTILHVVEGRALTSQMYVAEVQEPIVIPFIPFIGDEFKLMHDNSRPHTANRVRELRQDNNVDVLQHPPWSPDMNAMEHVWDYLKEEIKNTEVRPETLRDLKKAVLEEWDRMSQDFVDTLIQSMPKRVTTLTRPAGGNTRY